MNKIFSLFLSAVLEGLMMVIVFSCTTKPKLQEPVKEDAEFENPAAAAEWEFHMLKDRSGKIPAHVREEELAQARAIYERQTRARLSSGNAYTLEGPTNIGGRSRCVRYDARYNGTTNRTVLAGGVSGGIYKTTDAYNWVRKSPTSAIYSVTSLIQDPRPGHQDTWYYSTGESLGSNEDHSAPGQSDGVFKSNNNGETWTRLPNSNPGVYESFDRREDMIWRLLVNPFNGDIYMAALGAILRSQDGGNSWQQVLGDTKSSTNSFQSTDIIITTSGKFYAAFAGYTGAGWDGVWTSGSGDPGTWTRIAGEGAGGAPDGWDREDQYGRIVLAPVPSDGSVVYAYVQSFVNLCSASSRGRLFRWNNSTGTWTDLSVNLPGCAPGLATMNLQGGYNMLIHVKPDDPNVIFLGADNLYRSTDGFTTNTRVSAIGGYMNWGLHPDVHWMDFMPGHSNVLLCATDGGIYMTDDDLASFVNWTPLNSNFTTVQYYHIAVDPQKGSNRIIGGTQDNGTLRKIGNSSFFESIGGGDGLAVGISKETAGNSYEYLSYQSGSVLRKTTDGYAVNITPSSIPGYYSWYTYFKLDADNTENLYYCKGQHLVRNTSASLATSYNWTTMDGVTSVSDESHFITALATTRGQYDPHRSSLFIGYDGAKLFRLDDPVHADASTVPVNITGAAFPEWGYVSSISVNPRNDDTLLLTLSNYGTVSMWWTGNAHSSFPTWINVERNLTLPSIRSSAIAVTANGVEYFVGTSVGLFHSANPLTTDWTQESPEGIGNAVVTSLALRPSDNRLVIGTYGHAIWSTTLSSEALPVTLLDFAGQVQGSHVALDWYTSAEWNSERFDIQRSYDGIDFINIGSVAAMSNSSSVHHYQFVDPDAISSNSYYRLKMIDLDGQYQFSKVVLVQQEKTTEAITVVNPFHDQVKLKLSQSVRDKVEASLFDLSGKLVGKEELPGGPELTLRFGNKLASLNKGVYMLQVKTGGQTFRLKLIKE